MGELTMCFRPAEIQLNKCPQCGKVNKPIARECAECGEPLNAAAPMVTCPICGLQNPATATECGQCGATEAQIMAAMAKGGGAPKPPTAPRSAPGAPKPPTAPSAPKPPVAPGAPKPPAVPPGLSR
ncbi:MAG: zinc ribbon domain-containing protein [Coriobacteriales bacterium]|nr:zinc ribbon domain-containing protein [Coriobacteriales bacterium]